MAKPKANRQSIIAMSEFAHIREALTLGAEAHMATGTPFDPFKPIRETPLSVFYDKSPDSFEQGRLNPNLAQIWFHQYGIRIGETIFGLG